MASLFRRAEEAAPADTSSSSSKKKKKASKKRSSDEAFGPDCMVEIGDGGTSLRADRFVLAARSEYFRAAFKRGENSFREGAAGRVTLAVQEPLPSAAASRAVLGYLYTGSLSGTSAAAASSSSSLSAAPSLNPNDAIDVLHVTGTDDGGGYLQLRDNEQLRAEARSLVTVNDGNAFSLLRRADATLQQEVKGPIFEHLLQPACGSRIGGGGGEEEWWSDKQEIAMCHEVIDTLLSREEDSA